MKIAITLSVLTLESLLAIINKKVKIVGLTLSKGWLPKSLTPRFWVSTYAIISTNPKISLMFELDPETFFFIDKFKCTKPFSQDNLIKILLKALKLLIFLLHWNYLTFFFHFLTMLVGYDLACSFQLVKGELVNLSFSCFIPVILHFISKWKPSNSPNLAFSSEIFERKRLVLRIFLLL